MQLICFWLLQSCALNHKNTWIRLGRNLDGDYWGWGQIGYVALPPPSKLFWGDADPSHPASSYVHSTSMPSTHILLMSHLNLRKMGCVEVQLHQVFNCECEGKTKRKFRSNAHNICNRGTGDRCLCIMFFHTNILEN